MKEAAAFDLIIFDLDGTLVDSRYDLTDAVNFALKELGHPLITFEQLPSMVGSGIRKLIELALGDFSESDYEAARVLFNQYYSENYTNKTTFFKEIPEVLNFFQKKKKAVYSNKAHPFTVKIINDLKLAGHFDMVLGSNPNLYKRKPSPEGIFYILKTLGVDASRAIMVGDSTHDIHAAQQAGVASCAVTYGYRSREILKAAAPDYIIDNILDLKKWVK